MVITCYNPRCNPFIYKSYEVIYRGPHEKPKPHDIHQPFFSEKNSEASEAQKLEREQDKGVGVSFVHISCLSNKETGWWFQPI